MSSDGMLYAFASYTKTPSENEEQSEEVWAARTGMNPKALPPTCLELHFAKWFSSSSDGYSC
jgi:hypothetical protein